MQNDPTPRRRVPTWLVAVASAVLGADGARPDRDEMTDEKRSTFRDAARSCAEEQGLDRRRRCRPGRLGAPADA